MCHGNRLGTHGAKRLRRFNYELACKQQAILNYVPSARWCPIFCSFGRNDPPLSSAQGERQTGGVRFARDDPRSAGVMARASLERLVLGDGGQAEEGKGYGSKAGALQPGSVCPVCPKSSISRLGPLPTWRG